MKAIHNVQLITNKRIEKGKAILFDEKIIDIIPEEALPSYQSQDKLTYILDGKGRYLSPGFIDIHIHGCAGFDTMDEESDALRQISQKLPATGVTSFLPTTMTMAFPRIEGALENIKNHMNINHERGAQILGCHLEGPFISPKYKGAQDENHMIIPDFSKIEDYKKIIKTITLAPELPHSIPFIQKCLKAGIRISLGHTAADYETAMRAIAAGAAGITHTFNAMTPFSHRAVGVAGAAMDSETVCELIADNIHVHPAAQRLLLKAKGTEKIILISDAIRAAMMPEGIYELGGQTVSVKNGQALLAESPAEDRTLAGSILTLNQAAANFMENTGLSLAEVIYMVTEAPAKYMGVYDKKGSLSIGKSADLTIFDKNLHIDYTFVKGAQAFGAQQIPRF